MHSMGMTHGDIKPDNLLLGADGQVRLCDLGSSQRCGADDLMIRTVGTPAFFSPEMCDGRPYSARAADVWALGICLYIFVFGEMHPDPYASQWCLQKSLAVVLVMSMVSPGHQPSRMPQHL